MPAYCTSQRSKYFLITHRTIQAPNEIIWRLCACSVYFLLRMGSYLRWQENGRDEGISIPWQNISLHAISNTPVKCIYIMLDTRIDYPCGTNGNGRAHENRNGDDEDDDEGTCEGKMHYSFHIRPFEWNWFISFDASQMMNQKWQKSGSHQPMKQPLKTFSSQWSIAKVCIQMRMVKLNDSPNRTP